MLSKNSNNYLRTICVGILAILLLSQCKQENKSKPYIYELRSGWQKPIIPDNNPLTLESIALGRLLFYDTALSVDSSLSCGSCHFPKFGFADNKSISQGVDGRKGIRNSGTLTNVAYLPYFNRDGGVKTLDIFASVPIEDHQEMGFNLLLAGKRIRSNQAYNNASKSIYKRDLDGFVITRALASFLRTFISDNSQYDRYIDEEEGANFNDAQLRGKELFFGPNAKCNGCHSGKQFTDYSFQNNGLYRVYSGKDRGRERITHDPNDEGKFRVATLRNVEITAPYMHDGSLLTLKSVLQHYSSNGSDHKNKNPIINQISLTPQEEDDIIEFLKTLTDREFINNPDYSPS